MWFLSVSGVRENERARLLIDFFRFFFFRFHWDVWVLLLCENCLSIMSYRPGRRGDDSDEESSSSSKSKKSSAAKRSINEALKRALDLASNPGDGDEEPEVLPAPEVEVDPSKVVPGTEEDGEGEEMDVSSPEPSPAKGGGSIVAVAKKVTAPASAATAAVAAPMVDSDDDDDFDPRQERRRVRAEVGGGEDDEEDDAALDAQLDAQAEEIQLLRNHRLNNPLPLSNMRERAKYIPLRLTYEERKTLRLVAAAIAVSDYTNIVDVQFKQRTRRQHTQLQQIVAFLTGLVSAIDYEQGQQVLQDRNFQPHEPMLRDALEIFRRYKIINPDKFRSEYGKLIYLMQDSLSEQVQPLLEISLHKPIRTVYALLEEHQALALLDDPLISIATNEILNDKNKSRAKIQRDIKQKEQAAELLVRRYKTATLSSEMIRQCLYSIGDNVSFLNANLKPVLDCIDLLKEFFDPATTATVASEGATYSLGIAEGRAGARLTHSHETQYHYVLQSLTLWANILEDMYRLWYLAEQELLNSTVIPYELKDTGQGLQRVQRAPRVFAAMHDILTYTQRQLTLTSEGNVHVVSSGNQGYNRNWVGTSVVHLGDHNVPNALVFIDKYAQVSRILSPLMTTLRNLERLVDENAGLERYMQTYGGLRKAKKDILHDFFTHGFDGSGGDNFFDAGSCIDGRLTSAWHWCSQLASKPFYPLFKLTGFASFDGEFDK